MCNSNRLHDTWKKESPRIGQAETHSDWPGEDLF